MDNQHLRDQLQMLRTSYNNILVLYEKTAENFEYEFEALKQNTFLKQKQKGLELELTLMQFQLEQLKYQLKQITQQQCPE